MHAFLTINAVAVSIFFTEVDSHITRIRHYNPLYTLRAGYSSTNGLGDKIDRNDSSVGDRHRAIVFSGSADDAEVSLDGIYSRSTIDVNGRPHFLRIPMNDNLEIIHLYWLENKWVFAFDTESRRGKQSVLAYGESDVDIPYDTESLWYIKSGREYLQSKSFRIIKPDKLVDTKIIPTVEVMGVPKVLWPIFAAFMLDAIAVGLVMPLLPFYVMQLNANALQLSMVVSANYVAQMIGCVLMGRVSDRYGRKLVTALCLSASTLSYLCVSTATTLRGVALARIISGSCGGLIPIIQSTVSDVISVTDRPKYLGRIQAAFGLGFVLGPMVSALLPWLSAKHKIRLAAVLPFAGLLICLSFLKESKADLRTSSANNFQLSHNTNASPIHCAADSDTSPSTTSNPSFTSAVTYSGRVSLPVAALVLSGFLLMYAFGTETIYAMLLNDAFGYGERALSTVLAVNGLLIGVFQIFLIKHLVARFGNHVTLSMGNAMLALGMIGVGLCRNKPLHFLAFAVHIIGYSIADTGVASLISSYASSASQGRDLAFNQAAQACARVFSPMIAGILYERSLKAKILPVGALPYVAGALFPAVGVAIPLLLKNMKSKKIS